LAGNRDCMRLLATCESVLADENDRSGTGSRSVGNAAQASSNA